MSTFYTIFFKSSLIREFQDKVMLHNETKEISI